MPWLLHVLAFAALLSPASAQEADYWVSSGAGVFRIKRESGKLRFVGFPPITPYYGQWWNGNYIVPDFEFDEIWSIDPAGNATLLSSGGWLDEPITVQVSPSNELWIASLGNNKVLTIDAAGVQTVRFDVSSHPWMETPSGISFGPDGELYLGQYEDGDIWKLDPVTGAATLVTDGGGVMDECAAIHADGSGNLFVADFGGNQIVRVRVEDGSVVVLSADPILMEPNDIRVTKEGTILTTTFGTSALCEIALDGTTTVLYQEPAFGTFEGISIPKDFPYSTGRCIKYGSGLAGTGGFVPDLRGVLSPTIGGCVGLEHRFALGGTIGFTLFGIAEGSFSLWGGTVLVDLAQPWGLLPLAFGGSGAGNGTALDYDTLPDDPSLVGDTYYLQDLVVDHGAPKKIALSNGLQFIIGS